MKKKLFFLLAMVATFMCLLAVVSFAENQPDASRGTVTLEDNTVLELYDEEGDALIWYISGTETVGETTKNVYSYIEAQDPRVTYTATSWQGSINGVAVNQVETISLTVDGVTYPTSKFVVFNIKDKDVAINAGPSKIGQSVNCLQKSFNGSKSIEYVYLREDFLAFQANAFSSCSNLKYLNFEELSSLVNLTSQAFSGCNDLLVGQTLDLSKTKLTNMQSNSFAYTGFTSVILPSTVTTFSNSAFENTAITSLTIPDTITSFGAYVFKKCSKLTTVTGFAALFERGVLTGIPTSTFESCSMLTSVDFPSSFTSVGGSAFFNCSSLTGTFKVSNNCSSIGSQAFQGAGFETIVLGGTYTELGNYSLRDMKKLKNVYISSKITSIPGEVFRDVPQKVVFYYTGSSAQGLLDANAGGYNYTITNVTSEYQIHIDNWDPETRNAEKPYIIYGVNECFAFYDNKHTLTGTDCTVDDACKICALPVEGQAEHNIVKTLVYPNGFTQVGVYTCDCIFNGCTVIDIKAGDEGSEAAALFNGGEGFSTKGDDGIAGGYTIDVDAVKKYKEINGSFTMGIMVVNPNYYYGKDSFFDATGKINTTGGAIQVELVDNQYKNVSVAITGFTGNAESVSLVIALYAYEDVENVEFIQSSTTACGDKNVTVGGKTLYTVTLASVKAGNSDLSNLGDYEIPKKDEE